MSRICLSLFFVVAFMFSVFPIEVNALTADKLIRGANEARLAIENGELHYIFRYNYVSWRESEEAVAAWMERAGERTERICAGSILPRNRSERI